MIITFVMDQYGETSNGTSCTAMRFADTLKKKGHEVRVITASQISGDGVYVLPEHKIPIFQYIIDKNGMKFATPVDDVIRKAIEGSDVVHMLMPFKVQKRTVDIAKEMNVATTAAFHLQPENITYSIKLQKVRPINAGMYRHLKKFYDKFAHVHCPSAMLENILDKYRYTSRKHVISNGIDPDFRKSVSAVRPSEWDGKFVIVMSGRFSREKRQDVLIKAVAQSKYADKIQLVLCGKGPWQKKLEKMSRALPNPAVFKFCSKSELVDILSVADLYVHASEVELEAISCMEAFACGLVPVIASAQMSATKQFALTDRNLFDAGDRDMLTERIEWFIEHPEEKKELSARYESYAEEFAIEPCVDKMIEVFEQAVADNRERVQNSERERIYLESADKTARKNYLKEKKKYLRALYKRGKADYTESFIDTVAERERTPERAPEVSAAKVAEH